jgi:aminoglycoside phosphotransferase (APT) family kinase protein
MLRRMPAPGIPAAEYPIDEALVRSLLREQFPQLGDESICAVGEGWDNAMFRLGEELAVRLPRRASAAPLLLKEREGLPEIAPIASALVISVPVHVQQGVPGCGYPWNWSIVPWLRGVPADGSSLADEECGRLGGFLRCLHGLAPTNAPPRNPFRGVPLKERAADMKERIERLRGRDDLPTEKILQAWREALDAPTTKENVLIHGDLHAGNVLTENGRITGIIDWGDLTIGDAATDLAALWTVLDSASARRGVVAAYPPQPRETWVRARGWAVLFCLVLMDNDDARHMAMGRRIGQRLEESDIPPKQR